MRVNHIFQHKAIAYVSAYGATMDYQSGWWDSPAKAKAEVEHLVESHVPAGIYQVGIKMKVKMVSL